MFALLEFINGVQLADVTGDSLTNMSYGDLITVLTRSGLLSHVISLPSLIDVSRADDESLGRLCMKLLISLMFKGQQVANQPLVQFNSDLEVAKGYRSIFDSSGVRDENEIKQIMSNFIDLTKKLHNFEISQMHQESYVQYLHLLSCVSLNCSALQGNDPRSFAQANTEFLIQNIEHLSEIYVREDHRKRLLNSDLQGQRTMLYQFFFVAYLLSISTA